MLKILYKYEFEIYDKNIPKIWINTFGQSLPNLVQNTQLRVMYVLNHLWDTIKVIWKPKIGWIYSRRSNYVTESKITQEILVSYYYPIKKKIVYIK